MERDIRYINVYDDFIPSIVDEGIIFPTEQSAKEGILNKEHYVKTKKIDFNKVRKCLYEYNKALYERID